MMAAFMKFATDGRVAEAAMFVQTLVERKLVCLMRPGLPALVSV